MPLFTASERQFVQAVSDLGHCNPFLPERFECERRALGNAYRERPAVLSLRDALDDQHPNVDRLVERAAALLERAAAALARERNPARPDAGEWELYEDLALFLFYHQFRRQLDELILNRVASTRRVACWAEFERACRRYGVGHGDADAIAHRFALCHQLRRAFRHIFNVIVGESMPTARLRAAVWQSVFTHDMRRYRRALFERMGDMTCLITGASGTGKELVAQAIGLSRYIPFDPRAQAFADDYLKGFTALNISALPPTLIESELFGHKRGAFTGALQDRAGWLEACPARGTVFLDEIGELEGALQVKLLRVLQTRTFTRTGETIERTFRGKIIAATNRDLDREMAEGRFRADLYYRICSDIIRTPSLREQLADTPDALVTLVSFLAQRMIGEIEGPALTEEVVAWIGANLGPDYPWPGNVRELEQCVRNILIRKSYLASGHARARASAAAPASGLSPAIVPASEQYPDPARALAEAVAAGSLTLEELTAHYCALVHAQSGSWQATARRLGVDHRTVKSRVSAGLLERYRGATR